MGATETITRPLSQDHSELVELTAELERRFSIHTASIREFEGTQPRLPYDVPNSPLDEFESLVERFKGAHNAWREAQKVPLKVESQEEEPAKGDLNEILTNGDELQWKIQTTKYAWGKVSDSKPVIEALEDLVNATGLSLVRSAERGVKPPNEKPGANKTKNVMAADHHQPQKSSSSLKR